MRPKTKYTIERGRESGVSFPEPRDDATGENRVSGLGPVPDGVGLLDFDRTGFSPGARSKRIYFVEGRSASIARFDGEDVWSYGPVRWTPERVGTKTEFHDREYFVSSRFKNLCAIVSRTNRFLGIKRR